MSSERDNRQRAAARARLEREMATRQEAARRRRVLQARIGAGVAAVVVLGAVIWIIVAATGGEGTKASTTTTAADCQWTNTLAGLPTPTVDPSASPGTTAAPSLPAGIKDVGLPPTTVPKVGYQVLTFDTNLGPIKVEMDLAKAPCTAASMAHLASKAFYDNTSCHRLVQTIFALQCGDPSGSGSGGATYSFADENLPTGKLPAYHAGDVAMANTGQAGSNGTQFFFVYDTSQLPGKYSLWGRVVEGEDIVAKVAAGGDDDAYQAQAGGGHPKTPLTFTTVTAGPVTPHPTPTPPTPQTPTPTPTPKTS